MKHTDIQKLRDDVSMDKLGFTLVELLVAIAVKALREAAMSTSRTK
jgi:prepilin-type N-terminal cleavage/methylation domain-containing protein